MHSPLHSISVVAFSVVAIVLPVSGFAQSNSRLQPMLARSSVTVARPYVATESGSHDITALPLNLLVADVYRPAVEAMRLRSATFRRQCARIAAAPELLVEIESDPPRSSSSKPLALTTISRYEYGRVHAVVRLAMSTRTPELIAHELEHVLEQLDGVDLRAMSRLPSSGVRTCDCGGTAVFETSRAVATGLRVEREIAPD